jgi:hypothetical protein
VIRTNRRRNRPDYRLSIRLSARYLAAVGFVSTLPVVILLLEIRGGAPTKGRQGGLLVHWFKHAFAVDPPGPAEPTESQRLAVDRIADEVIRRGLTTPTLMALEMSRPLSFIGSQAMHFFSPFVSVFTDTTGYRQFAEFLEQRGSIGYICDVIEAKNRSGEAEIDDGEDSAGPTTMETAGD